MKYVGKTYRYIKDRFQEHIAESNRERSFSRDLYVAMRAYGIENFEIVSLGVYEQGELEKKEIEYIELYDTFKNGYNQTLGGDGKRYISISDEELTKLYYELGSINKVAEAVGHDSGWISKILKSNGVEIATHKFEPVLINELNMRFIDICSCARWLKENGYTKPSAKLRNVAKGIRRAINGDRKQYVGFTFTLLK